MAERIPQSATIRIPLQAYLTSDHVSPATGKTIAITISKNGAAYGNPSAGATNATAIGNGSYYVDLSTSDTDTQGPLFILGTSSGVDAIVAIYNVVSSVTGGFSGNVVQSGTAQAGSTNTITLSSAASATNGLYDPAIVRVTGGTGAGQSRLIIDYNGTSKIAVVDRDWRTAPDNTSVYDIMASTNLFSTNEGLAQAGAAGTITLNASASSVNDTYVGQTLVLRTGTGQDQSRIITAYNGTTKIATVDTNWVTNPTSSSGYMIYQTARLVGAALGVVSANMTQIAGQTANAAAGVTFPSLIASPTNITAGIITTISGNVTGSVGTVNALAANVITAASMAPDATDEIWAKACTEPVAVVGASPTAIAALSWLLTLSRNTILQTATTQTLKADNTTTTIAASTISDDGTTFTRGEFA